MVPDFISFARLLVISFLGSFLLLNYRILFLLLKHFNSKLFFHWGKIRNFALKCFRGSFGALNKIYIIRINSLFNFLIGDQISVAIFLCLPY